ALDHRQTTDRTVERDRVGPLVRPAQLDLAPQPVVVVGASDAGRLRDAQPVMLEQPALAVAARQAKLAQRPPVGDPRLAAGLAAGRPLVGRDADPHLDEGRLRTPGAPSAADELARHADDRL